MQATYMLYRATWENQEKQKLSNYNSLKSFPAAVLNKIVFGLESMLLLKSEYIEGFYSCV